MHAVKLMNKFVGDGYPCYTISEIGVGFRNFEEGKRLVDASIEAGADAVKFQTYEADTVTTKNIFFDLETTGHISQYEFHKKYELPKDLQRRIMEYAKNIGITVFSAPSHIKDLEIMEEMDNPIYKIGSDLACHIPLLKKIAKFGKPIILSTGMCTLEEVKNSVNAIKDQGNEDIILLHCIANYPSKPEEANLNAIPTMKKEFDIPVGYSDHTIGLATTLSGVALGANVIERHFRDINNAPGPDDAHSLVKEEFARMVNSIKDIELAKGNGEKKPSRYEQKNLLTNRVSIIAMQEISAGTTITKEMIDISRPGSGIQPIHYDEIIGKKVSRDIQKEEPLRWEMIE